jgi:UDP-N-acetylmuramyl pentapeptide synthase
VVEVGIDGPGQMVRHAGILRPNIVVVTSITSEHNRSLPSLRVTREEKVQMVRRLSAEGLAVLNGDDANVRWMAGQTRARIVWFGLGESNDVRAEAIEVDWPHGTAFTLHARGQQRRVRIPLLGAPGVYAALAAVVAALELGQALDEVVAALGKLAPVSGRLCPVALPSGALLIADEKNSSEDSIIAGLAALADLPAQRRIVVMGEIFEPQKKAGALYRSIGERVGAVADLALFLVGKNRVSPLRAGAACAGMAPADMHMFGHDLGRAVAFLRDELRPGDVILLKGRGTEHLERITLGLQGRDIRCTLSLCKVPEMRCERCPQLAIGTPS